jgi:hypothetical protein
VLRRIKDLGESCAIQRGMWIILLVGRNRDIFLLGVLINQGLIFVGFGIFGFMLLV